MNRADAIRRFETESTPKRNPTVENWMKRRSSYISMRSPIGSRLSRPEAAKPRTPIFQRHLNALREAMKKDELDGWIDEEALLYTPEPPRKAERQMTPRRRYTPRALFQQPPQQPNKPVTSRLAQNLSTRTSYLREALKSKITENERLKKELEMARSAQIFTGELPSDNTRLELIQLRQENESLKAELKWPSRFSNENDLIKEITRRDEYIAAADKHHNGVLETLKAKYSSELTNKKVTIAELESKLAASERERAELRSTVDQIQERINTDCHSLMVFMFAKSS